MKKKSIFECAKCGSQFPKWEGRCRECGSWGTIVENFEPTVSTEKQIPAVSPAEIISFDKLESKKFNKLDTKIKEFNRVLGGGIVPGSLVLIGGEPGIGKSTLLLQILSKISENKKTTLYVSGEESGNQVKMRLDRLSLNGEYIKFTNETITEKICSAIEKVKPSLAVIDSIQTIKSIDIQSSEGSINQVSASCSKLAETAKRLNIPIFIIGHITKTGIVAGPKTLEHLVDTVLYLEGDKNHLYRILRSVKNRFGSVDEIGIFKMTQKGLCEVKNPSLEFIENIRDTKIGSSIAVIMEGTRPLMVEIQALTSKTYFGYPKRATSGFKKSRLEVLIAILTKRLNLNLGEYDIYLNIAGGLKITEPAADLPAALAIISSFKNKPIQNNTCIFGELGLGGEVRTVPFFEKRIKEANNLGFNKIICPKTKNKALKNISIKQVNNISEINL